MPGSGSLTPSPPKQLLKYFPASALPELPAKRFLRSFDPGYLRKKQANLQAYLKALVAVPGIMQHAAVQQFLSFTEHVRTRPQPTSTALC